jgi:hypothetical protein
MIIAALWFFMTLFGFPRVLRHDRGLEFLNEALKSLCEKYGIIQVPSSSYSPTTQGQVEKSNGVIFSRLTKMCLDNSYDNWEMFLPNILFGIITQKSARTGISPLNILLGYQPRLPLVWNANYHLNDNYEDFIVDKKIVIDSLKLRENAILATRKCIQLNNERYLESHYNNNAPAKIGDFVFVKAFKKKKGEPRWRGPFVVTGIFASGCKVKYVDGSTGVHQWQNVKIRRQHSAGGDSGEKEPPVVASDEGTRDQIESV